jgi:hypothetical protein
MSWNDYYMICIVLLAVSLGEVLPAVTHHYSLVHCTKQFSYWIQFHFVLSTQFRTHGERTFSFCSSHSLHCHFRCLQQLLFPFDRSPSLIDSIKSLAVEERCSDTSQLSEQIQSASVLDRKSSTVLALCFKSETRRLTA